MTESKKNYLLAGCGLLIGCSVASQAGINYELRLLLNSPVQAGFISFLVGASILGVLAFVQRGGWFKPGTIAKLPWWAWLGGVFGAFAVVVFIVLAPVLGALTLAVLVVCGQVLASLVLDHKGWLGFPRIALSMHRVLGALLIVVGVILTSIN